MLLNKDSKSTQFSKDEPPNLVIETFGAAAGGAGSVVGSGVHQPPEPVDADVGVVDIFIVVINCVSCLKLF